MRSWKMLMVVGLVVSVASVVNAEISLTIPTDGLNPLIQLEPKPPQNYPTKRSGDFRDLVRYLLDLPDPGYGYHYHTEESITGRVDGTSTVVLSLTQILSTSTTYNHNNYGQFMRGYRATIPFANLPAGDFKIRYTVGLSWSKRDNVTEAIVASGTASNDTFVQSVSNYVGSNSLMPPNNMTGQSPAASTWFTYPYERVGGLIMPGGSVTGDDNLFPNPVDVGDFGDIYPPLSLPDLSDPPSFTPGMNDSIGGFQTPFGTNGVQAFKAAIGQAWTNDEVLAKIPYTVPANSRGYLTISFDDNDESTDDTETRLGDVDDYLTGTGYQIARWYADETYEDDVNHNINCTYWYTMRLYDFDTDELKAYWCAGMNLHRPYH